MKFEKGDRKTTKAVVEDDKHFKPNFMVKKTSKNRVFSIFKHQDGQILTFRLFDCYF